MSNILYFSPSDWASKTAAHYLKTTEENGLLMRGAKSLAGVPLNGTIALLSAAELTAFAPLTALAWVALRAFTTDLAQSIEPRFVFTIADGTLSFFQTHTTKAYNAALRSLLAIFGYYSNKQLPAQTNNKIQRDLLHKIIKNAEAQPLPKPTTSDILSQMKQLKKVAKPEKIEQVNPFTESIQEVIGKLKVVNPTPKETTIGLQNRLAMLLEKQSKIDPQSRQAKRDNRAKQREQLNAQGEPILTLFDETPVDATMIQKVAKRAKSTIGRVWQNLSLQDIAAPFKFIIGK